MMQLVYEVSWPINDGTYKAIDRRSLSDARRIARRKAATAIPHNAQIRLVLKGLHWPAQRTYVEDDVLEEVTL